MASTFEPVLATISLGFVVAVSTGFIEFNFSDAFESDATGMLDIFALNSGTATSVSASEPSPLLLLHCGLLGLLAMVSFGTRVRRIDS